MKTRQEVAARFRTLPFAFLSESQGDELARLIEIGEYGQAIRDLQSDIRCHKQCGNYIKAGHEEKTLADLRALAKAAKAA